MKGENQTGNKTKKTVILLLAALLVVILAVLAFVLVRGQMKDQSYSESVKSAEKYLAAGNYEKAIKEYKEAISVRPEEVDAYIALADVYVETEQTSKAKAILNKGMLMTKSPKIDWYLNRLEGESLVSMASDGEKEKKLTVNLEDASKDIGWNTSFLQKIEEYTFDDYKRDYGTVVSAEMKGGFLEVVHSGFKGTFYYRNTDENQSIVDDSRKLPFSQGMPEKIMLDSLSPLFRNFEGGMTLDRLQMFIGKKVKPKTLERFTGVEFARENCSFQIETDKSGNITSYDAENEILLLNANKKEKETGKVSGVVQDAVTGDGVSQAELTFRNQSGGTSEQTVADASGAFETRLDAGTYNVTVQAEGYIEETFVFVVEEGRNYSGVQFVISPELASGTARIVLEWNAEPQDLDSYLSGQTDKGENVAVSFYNKRAESGGKLLAELDLDDTDGYGPETTTIYDLNGTYQFRVADFRRTGTMQQYGATVKVYLPGREPVTITMSPDAGVTDIWNVCEIDHGEVRVLNSAPASDNFVDGSK